MSPLSMSSWKIFVASAIRDAGCRLRGASDGVSPETANADFVESRQEQLCHCAEVVEHERLIDPCLGRYHSASLH